MNTIKADKGWWHVYVTTDDIHGPIEVFFNQVIGWQDRGDGQFDPISVQWGRISVERIDLSLDELTLSFVVYSEEHPNEDDAHVRSRIEFFKVVANMELAMEGSSPSFAPD